MYGRKLPGEDGGDAPKDEPVDELRKPDLKNGKVRLRGEFTPGLGNPGHDGLGKPPIGTGFPESLCKGKGVDHRHGQVDGLLPCRLMVLVIADASRVSFRPTSR